MHFNADKYKTVLDDITIFFLNIHVFHSKHVEYNVQHKDDKLRWHDNIMKDVIWFYLPHTLSEWTMCEPFASINIEGFLQGARQNDFVWG